MAVHSIYESADPPRSPLVELQPRLTRQFYQPVILLKALLETNRFPKRSPADDGHRAASSYEPEHIFRDFVNRLALICQTEPKGNTVSSCVVLQEPDRVSYVFASNYRSPGELRAMAESLRGILARLPPAPGDDPSSLGDEAGEEEKLRDEILDEILLLSRRRVGSYLSALEEALALCIEDCGEGKERADPELELRLAHIMDLVVAASASASQTSLVGEEDRYPAATKAVAASALALNQSRTLFGKIRRRIISEDRAGRNPNSWYKFCHITDRLLAYRTAVASLFDARQIWPELFDVFDVSFVPSPTPLKSGSTLTGPPKKSTQLARMLTSESALLAKYEAQAAELQHKYDFNEVIKDEWKRDRKMTVHAEMQILGWLESSEGRTRPERFFGGYRYVGSSKPTCRLCSYFFLKHPSGVEVRPSHANLYPAWRPYDVYEEQGPAAAESREMTMREMKKRIVHDIARALDEKFVDGRHNDSTDMVRKPHGGSVGTGSLLESLSSGMAGMSIAGDAGRDRDDASVIVYPGREGPKGFKSRRR